MNEFGLGLTISGIGILITFSALGILIVLILLLRALFPVRDNGNAADPPGEILPGSSPSREALKKQAAAAGVLALIRLHTSARSGSLGKLLEEPVGQWWKRGLDRNHEKE
ncbi:MAG: hypothetical protein MUP11_05250 [Anaerolineales bacterium]|nr:hypothetical protein [Anaerolineales bacterium]